MRVRVGSFVFIAASLCAAIGLSPGQASATPVPSEPPATTVAAEAAAATPTTSPTQTESTGPVDGTPTIDGPATIDGAASQGVATPDTAAVAGQKPLAPGQEGPVGAGGSAAERGTSLQVTPIPAHPVPEAERLPANSGNGKRIVYHKTRQRVWLIDNNENVVRTYLVSGRLTWNQPSPGTYHVFSRSRWTCAVQNPSVCWPYMIRFTYGPGGLAIGFHEIPTNRATGRKLQSLSQLGQPLSAGCVRQSPDNAAFLWGWAPVGTKVVVIQ